MTGGGHYTGLIDRYRDRLPVSDDDRVISLCEGDSIFRIFSDEGLKDISADFKDGVLSLKAPKREEPVPAHCRISIN